MRIEKLVIGLGLLLGSTGAWADSGQTARPVVVERMVKMYGPAQPPASLFPTLQKDPLGHLLALQRRNWGAAESRPHRGWLSTQGSPFKIQHKLQLLVLVNEKINNLGATPLHNTKYIVSVTTQSYWKQTLKLIKQSSKKTKTLKPIICNGILSI